MEDKERDDILRVTVNTFNTKPIQVKKIEGSWLSNTYLVTLKNKKVILRIVDPLHRNPLFYQYNNIHDEINSLKMLNSRIFSLFPRIIVYDDSSKIINKEYFFAEYCSGNQFDKFSKEFSKDEISQFYSQMGIYLNKVRQNHAESFGSVSDEKYRFNDWYEAVCQIVETIYSKAHEYRLVLPYDYDYFKKKLESHQLLFKEVKKPSLVFLNISENNFLVDSDLREISGLLGFGTPVYADPALQPVCSDLDENSNFMDCYNNGIKYSDGENKRISIYQIIISMVFILMGRVKPDKFNEFKLKTSKELQKGLINYKKYFETDF